MFSVQSVLKPSLKEAILLTIAIVGIISYCIIFLETVPHIPLLLAIFLLMLYGFIRKVPFHEMEMGVFNGAKSGMGAVFIFFFIGILISSWMLSGTIPTIIYVGFHLVTPYFFYAIIFVVTAIIGLCIGSSLTTVATAGVAFIGVAAAIDASLAITAGAIVSGAFFGDKMSPLSDTTNLAASIVEVDLFTHIRNMAWTTIPAFLFSIIAFAFLSPKIELTHFPKIEEMQHTLMKEELIHWYAIIPLIILLIFSIKKISAFITLAVSSAVAVCFSFIHTSYSLSEVFNILFSGYVSKTGNADIDALLTRGGMDSMMFTISLVLLALGLGGLLFTLGIIPKLFKTIEHKLKTVGSLIFSTALSAVGINVLVGEQYLSILLTGEAFKNQYDRLGLQKKNLSRALEDAGTVINPLVPWGVCGVFITKVLEVPTMSYLPFAFFCLLSPILTILFGITGFSISRK
ncbi:NhaC family Na+:H+ antiporter [Oikeobacillus pervagus]|uniref:NhaC family Na+:H+ antiporter n=1 Tax=Oikeobacillus pervagus TaxID=1325931 RepID=A0AAJ1WIZ3_9BACI|nr:Na+/H+ antiporter NhaC [Oikeobacillus pervagus]MDQ0214858.1 NhaC family Na+:H+ antiporter [Oikeobacillus pervagus]